MAASNSFNDYVTCPYNNAHTLLRGRLAKHLERCSRSLENRNQLLICPFNKSHRYNEEQLLAHVKECPDAAVLNAFRDCNKQPSPNNAVLHQIPVECEEDWDKEPDVPAYNPRAYCEENLIIRTNDVRGKSKAARREFRTNERRRFAEKM